MPAKFFVNLELSYVQERLRAAYLESGSGCPLLLLHGFMANANYWLPFTEILGSKYRCLAPDLLGFGDSSQPKIDYNLAVQVDFIHNFIVQLNLKRVVIMGHSFGSWVGAAYALQYPEVVKSLILTAPAGIRDDSFAARYNYLRPLLSSSLWVDRALKMATPMGKLLGKEAELNKIKYIRQELKNQPVARDFLRSRMKPEAAIDTVEKEIDRLQIPALVIAGGLDETIPLWHSQTYAEKIPQARLEIISGADHNLPQNYAKEMAILVENFLSFEEE
jgi:pimeloyl-ACP methyl ester carboxylesterase